MAAALALAGAAGPAVLSASAAGKAKERPPPTAGVAADPVPATSGTPKAGNVAAIVTVAGGGDHFTADYVAELVLAGAGGSGIYRTVPPEILSEALAKIGKGAAECATDDTCVRALAASLNLHHLLLGTLTGAAKKAELTVSIVTPGSLAVSRKPLAPVTGGEEAVIVAAPTLGESLAASPALGLLRLEGSAGVTIKVDGVTLGEAPLATAVLRLDAGKHEIALERAGHEPWRTAMTMDGGKRYVLRWKP